MEATALKNRVVDVMISNYKLLDQDLITSYEWKSLRDAYKQLFTEEEWEEVTDEVGTYVHTVVIKRNNERLNK